MIDKEICQSNKQIWCRKDIVERNVTGKGEGKLKSLRICWLFNNYCCYLCKTFAVRPTLKN